MYEIKNFENLIGAEGLSENALRTHFTLYQGYINNFNKLNDILMAMEKEGKYSTPEFAELNRRLGWEWNGMRLHELYFENLTKEFKKPDEDSPFFAALKKEFGSFEFWERDFKSMGAMRGIGWVIFYYDKSSGRLFNSWINEHDTGHLSGCVPLLVMDVFEHAYMLDYGTKRVDYTEAFFKNINWPIVEKRFK
ncbi:superoxide dismutase [Candidatus Wolfebacteria bacterium]|nr:superoxide dismutase [Candidatus Wolfebacteria bacterium]